MKKSQASYKQTAAVDEEDVFLGYEVLRRSDDGYDHSNQRNSLESGHIHSEERSHDSGYGYGDEKSAELSGIGSDV